MQHLTSATNPGNPSCVLGICIPSSVWHSTSLDTRNCPRGCHLLRHLNVNRQYLRPASASSHSPPQSGCVTQTFVLIRVSLQPLLAYTKSSTHKLPRNLTEREPRLLRCCWGCLVTMEHNPWTYWPDGCQGKSLPNDLLWPVELCGHSDLASLRPCPLDWWTKITFHLGIPRGRTPRLLRLLLRRGPCATPQARQAVQVLGHAIRVISNILPPNLATNINPQRSQLPLGSQIYLPNPTLSSPTTCSQERILDTRESSVTPPFLA